MAYRLVDAYPFGDWNWQTPKFAARFPLPAGTANLPLGSTPFYVAYMPADCANAAACQQNTSAFAQAFKTLLEKALIDRGYTVVQSPAGAVSVRFDVQSFLYDAGHNSHLIESETVWTILGTIGYQLRDISIRPSRPPG